MSKNRNEKSENRIDGPRRKWKTSEYSEIVRLCKSGDASYVVSRLLAAGIVRDGDRLSSFIDSLRTGSPNQSPAAYPDF